LEEAGEKVETYKGSTAIREQLGHILNEFPDEDKSEIERKLLEDVPTNGKKRDVLETRLHRIRRIKTVKNKNNIKDLTSEKIYNLARNSKSGVKNPLEIGFESKEKFLKFEKTVDTFDNIFIINPPNHIEMVDRKDQKYKTEVVICLDLGKHVEIFDRELFIVKYYTKYCPSHNLSAEDYIPQLKESKEKNLHYFNLSGDTQARYFLEPRISQFILEKQPNSGILHVITNEWITPTNSELTKAELLSFFPKAIAKGRKIKTLEDFAREYEILTGFKVEIVWKKQSTRQVGFILIQKKERSED